MKRISLTALLALTAALSVPPGALAAGGPILPVQGSAIGVPGRPYRYIASGAGRDTIVKQLRVGAATATSTLRVSGQYGVPGVGTSGSLTGLSADGRTLVLAEVAAGTPSTTTRLLVLDAKPRLALRAKVTLHGWSTVDAISPDGRWLYLIHYRSADISKYEVRAYDLLAHRLLAKPVVDPHDGNEAMTGFPITRVMSPDQRWAYTLYARPSGAPFVHALDTVGRRAVCVDLPATLNSDIGNASMTIGPGGGSLLIAVDGVPEARVGTGRFVVSAAAVRSPSTAVRPRAGGHAAARSSGGPSWTLIALAVAVLGALAAAAAVLPARPRRGADGARDDQPLRTTESLD